MFNLLTNLICVALLNTNPTPANPAQPKSLTFQASAFVTSEHKIRVAVEKISPEPVIVLLRNKYNEVLFRTTLPKNKMSYAARLDVNDLVDGVYKLEFISQDGSIEKNVAVTTPEVVQPVATRTISMK